MVEKEGDHVGVWMSEGFVEVAENVAAGVVGEEEVAYDEEEDCL